MLIIYNLMHCNSQELLEFSQLYPTFNEELQEKAAKLKEMQVQLTQAKVETLERRIESAR